MAAYHTQQRGAVLDVLQANIETPLSADAVTKRLSATPSAPGRSTVYRLLTKLTEEGVVRRFTAENGRQYLYQLTQDSCRHHLHLKCEDCGKLIHMDDSASENVLRTILKDAGFAVDKEETTLFGHCRDCSGKPTGKNET